MLGNQGIYLFSDIVSIVNIFQFLTPRTTKVSDEKGYGLEWRDKGDRDEKAQSENSDR
jgi:hypothetical protein